MVRDKIVSKPPENVRDFFAYLIFGHVRSLEMPEIAQDGASTASVPDIEADYQGPLSVFFF